MTMRTPVTIVMLLFVAASMAVAQTAWGCDQEQGAKLVSLQGQLFYDARQSGDWRPAQLDEILCEGGRVRVAAFSRASLALPSGVTLRLDEGTVLSLNGIVPSQPTLLNLLKGFIHFISRTPKQLTITTPIANAGPEGTEFAIGVDDAKARLWVYEGGVKFFNAQGDLHIGPGESAEAEPGTAPKTRIDLKPQDAVQWALYYPPLLPDVAGLSGELPAIVEAYRQGHINTALERLQTIPAEQQTADFFKLRSAIFLIAGRVEQAEQDIQRLLANNGNDAHALALSAVSALTRNRKNEAYQLAERALSNDANAAVGYAALSYVEQARFDLDKALSAAIKVCELSANDAMAWARRAELEQALGQTAASETSAQHALMLDARLERARTVMGFVHLSRLKFEQARDDFDAAIHLDSTAPLARLGLGLSKIRQGHLQAGRNDLEIAAILDPNNALIRSYLGKAYYEERRDALAQDQFALAKQLDPHDPTAFFYDAINKQTTNRPVAAIHAMQKATELNDNRAVYRSKLALDEDAAARSANLARMYNDAGFGRVAFKEAWSALNTDSNSPTAHRFLSDSYQGRARYRTARASELLQAQLLQPTNITPVQPQLSSENIGLLNSTGPGSLSINEYDPLYTANGAHVVANGAYGSNNTRTSNLVGSAVYDKLSLSGGQFHYQTDGYRDNNDYRQDVYDAFAQYAITPDLNMQVELKSENIRAGDVVSRLNGVYKPNYRNDRDNNSARIGGLYKISQNQNIIGSFIYTNFADVNKDHTYDTFDPADLLAYYNIKKFNPYRSNGQQTEIQHNYQGNLFNIKTGFGFLNVDYKKQVNNIAEWTYPPEPLPELNESTIEKDNISHYNGYIYSNQNLMSNVVTTLGLSYDDYNDGVTIKQQFNPKLGATWKPFDNLLLRSAFLRTLKRPLTTHQTIEPTQVAGFNQLFDSINGTSAWQYGVGADYTPFKNVFLGGELLWRDMNEPFRNGAMVDRNRTENTALAYIYWAPYDWLSFQSEYRFDKFSRDFVAGQGNRYDPRSLATEQVLLSMNFFHTSGLFARISSTYVRQKAELAVEDLANPLLEDRESFWTVDASLGLRFPKRIGTMAFEVRNLADNHFRYQSVFDPEGPQISPYIPERQFFVKLSLFY